MCKSMLKHLFVFYFLFNVNLLADDYFLTLRNDKVNLRLGPSFDYPIKIVYKKKYLPVLVKDKSDNFRKIKDHESNTGWIHISQLSKKKAGIITANKVYLLNKPTIYSRPIAKIEKGHLVLISKCKKIWCKVKTSGYSGWIEKKNILGRL